MEKQEKPTLGLIPRKIYERHVNVERLNDVSGAISRYHNLGLEIPLEWIEEYNELVGVVNHKQEKVEQDYYLDLSDEGYWLIKNRKTGGRFTAGYDKEKVVALIEKLNKTHKPNVIQERLHEIKVCWNEHKKSEGCNFVIEI